MNDKLQAANNKETFKNDFKLFVETYDEAFQQLEGDYKDLPVAEKFALIQAYAISQVHADLLNMVAMTIATQEKEAERQKQLSEQTKEFSNFLDAYQKNQQK